MCSRLFRIHSAPPRESCTKRARSLKFSAVPIWEAAHFHPFLRDWRSLAGWLAGGRGMRSPVCICVYDGSEYITARCPFCMPTPKCGGFTELLLWVSCARNGPLEVCVLFKVKYVNSTRILWFVCRWADWYYSLITTLMVIKYPVMFHLRKLVCFTDNLCI